MTTAELAEADQADTREREFDRRAQRIAARGLLLAVLPSTYAALAAYGLLPAMPWSPLG